MGGGGEGGRGRRGRGLHDELIENTLVRLFCEGAIYLPDTFSRGECIRNTAASCEENWKAN
jgi:hypothetical protein